MNMQPKCQGTSELPFRSFGCCVLTTAPRGAMSGRVNAFSEELQSLLAAPTLAPLLAGSDAAAPATPTSSDDDPTLSFAKSVIDAKTGGTVLPQLQGGLQLLSTELGERVSEQYESLITNVHATHALEAKLLRSNERVEALAQSVRRIRTQYAKPYARLQECVTQLERMQECGELLRQTQRALVLCKRLRESVAPPEPSGAGGANAAAAKPASDATTTVKPAPSAAARTDLPKAAQALRELEELFAAVDLRGIDAIETEWTFVQQASASVRSQALVMLRAGVKEQSQAQTGTALQVFFHLGELRQTAIEAAKHVTVDVRSAVAGAFDSAIFGPDAAQRLSTGGGVLGDLGAGAKPPHGMPPNSALAGWCEMLWSKADGLAEALFTASMRLTSLQRVLAKKRDPLTQALFATIFDEEAEAPNSAPAAERPPPTTARERVFAAAEQLVPLPPKGKYPMADPSLFDCHPALKALMETVKSCAGPAAVRAAPDGTGGTGGTGAAAGLAPLWAPLPDALRTSLTQATGASPFVRQMISMDLPRLMVVLSGVLPKLTQQLAPAKPPAEAVAVLSPEALLDCLSGTRELFEKHLAESLQRTSVAQMRECSALAASAPSAAIPAQARAGTEKRLGAAIEQELKRVAGCAPLERVVAASCAHAIGLFGAKGEGLLRLEEGETPAAQQAARLNGELLVAVQGLRADVYAQTGSGSTVSEPATALLLEGLAKLSPLITALANPATPLPDAKRGDAMQMLKQHLRRLEMVENV